MRRLIPLALTLGLGLLAACATIPAPRTPSQGVFAVQSAYIAAAHAQTNYLRSPYATPEAAAVIQRLDTQAYAALVPLRTAAQQGRVIEEAQVWAAETAVERLTAYLTSQGAT